ncbi:MAG: hypothetical protein ACK55I_17430 [bacterium]
MATQIAPAHVIGEDEEDVGLLRLGRCVGGVEQTQRREEEGGESRAQQDGAPS